jgi:hypothetical protein
MRLLLTIYTTTKYTTIIVRTTHWVSGFFFLHVIVNTLKVICDFSPRVTGGKEKEEQKLHRNTKQFHDNISIDERKRVSTNRGGIHSQGTPVFNVP